jgi:aconitate hydratase
MPSIDSLKTRRTLKVGSKTYHYYSLPAAEEAGLAGVSRLPVSMKVLLENQLRFEDGVSVGDDDLKAVAAWLENKGRVEHEISFRPARVLMQDFTGVPAVVDLAAMRDALAKLGADPAKINPLAPVDLVIDHSVMVDHFGTAKAFGENVEKEYERNLERYRFLRWGSSAFNNFRVVPPGTGICHQVNLEYLAQTVWSAEVDGELTAYPDTVVGTDSHTTMVNGLSVLGWGVGGIEAEAAMLGQPIPMLIPEVIGFRFDGALPEGATATDLVLTVTQMLRKKGVVGKFVEYFGPGLAGLTIEDQATIANMAPEYGATCGFFPVTQATLDYLAATGRESHRVALVEAYAKAQGMWSEPGQPEPEYSDTIELDLSTVTPSLAGPKRPQDRVPLSEAAAQFRVALHGEFGKDEATSAERVKVSGESHDVGNGDVVIAAITSCTNTSNPSVLIAAGLLAKNAVAKGLKTKPWVKTSLAPGSQVVTDYLLKAGLQKPLDALGFNLVGYGCTTCIGNSGPLSESISQAIADGDLVATSVLSGNRNFEGRVNPDTRANYLASPPLVVAYALAGSMLIDLDNDPIGAGKGGKPVYLKDIWPSTADIQALQKKSVTKAMFAGRYGDVFKGDSHWQGIDVGHGLDLCAEPALFRGPDHDPRADQGRDRGPHPRHLRRLDHHRPHQPGRQHPQILARRRIPQPASGRARGLQLLRRPTRQPRGDDARHLRQHPHPQQDHRRHRRRGDQALPLRRGDVDLRRGHALSGRGPSGGGVRRQGIRHRLLPRLGCQGHQAAGRPRRHRRELRAHPPLEPGRHGRAAPAVHPRRLAAPGPHRRGDRLHPRPRRRRPAQAADGRGLPSLRRQDRPLPRALPDRYAHGA